MSIIVWLQYVTYSEDIRYHYFNTKSREKSKNFPLLLNIPVGILPQDLFLFVF